MPEPPDEAERVKRVTEALKELALGSKVAIIARSPPPTVSGSSRSACGSTTCAGPPLWPTRPMPR